MTSNLKSKIYIIPSTFSTGLDVFDAILAAFSIENALKVVTNTLISEKLLVLIENQLHI